MNRNGRRAGAGIMQRQAERVMTVFPRWLVVWGTYSREFWAFPRFDGPIMHSPSAGELVGKMRSVQRSVFGECEWA